MSDESHARDCDGELGFGAPEPSMEPRTDAAAAAGSDDEGLPLGSLFKIKVPRVARKPKPSAPENPRAEEDDLGSTLASLMKKRVAPKKAKDREEPSVVKSSPHASKEKDGEEGIVGLLDSAEQCSDENMDDSLSGFLKRVQSGLGTKVQSVSRKRSRKERAQSVDDESFSLLHYDFSSQKGLVASRKGRKARGLLAKDAEDVSGELEENLMSPLAGRSGSLEGETSSPLDGTQKGSAAGQIGSKPRGRPHKEVGNGAADVLGWISGKELLEGGLVSLSVGSSGSLGGVVRLSADGTQESMAAGVRGRKPRGRPSKEAKAVGDSVDGGSNQIPGDKTPEEVRETHSHLARRRTLVPQKSSSVCEADVKVDRVRLEGDGSNRSSEEALGVPSLFHSLSSDPVLELNCKSAMTEENASSMLMGHDNQLSDTYNGMPKDFQPLKEETKKLENGLKHCSNGKMCNLVSEEVVVAISTTSPTCIDTRCESGPTSGKSAAGISETLWATSLPSNCVLRELIDGSRYVQVQDSCLIQTTKIVEESAVSGVLNQSIDTELKREILLKTNLKDVGNILVEEQLSDWCDETSCENTVHEDSLHILPKEIIGKPALNAEELSSVSERRQPKENEQYNELKELLPNTDQTPRLSSGTKMMGSVSPITGGLNKQYDGTSQGLFLTDCSKKEVGETYCGGLKEPPRGDPISLRSEHTLVNMQIKENLLGNGLPQSSSVNLSVNSEVAAQPAVSCTPTCEVPPANGYSPKQFVNNCSSTEIFDASRQDLDMIRDCIETSPQTNIMYLGETPLVATSVASDNDSADKQSSMPRAMRNLKKRRHYDMAYEGDADWEILIQEQGLFSNLSSINEDRAAKVKGRYDSHSPVMGQFPNGNISAVAAGLKACAAGPIEKIKFKEVLKRKGGLLDYLDCRNLILGLWSKNVNRILHLVDCGISETPSVEESQRESLIREIYIFLDRYGYINTGIASAKKNLEYLDLHHSETSNQSIPTENNGRKAASCKDEAAFVLDQGKISGNITSERSNTSFEVDKTTPLLDTEASERNLPVTREGSELSIQIKPEEHSVCSIKSGLPLKFTAVKTPTPNISTVGSENCIGWKGDMATGSHDLVSAVRVFCCTDGHPQESIATLDAICTAPSSIIFDSLPDSPVVPLEQREVSYDAHQPVKIEIEEITHGEKTEVISTDLHCSHATDTTASACDVCKRIIVVGAGPAGLTAARHLQRQGFSVIVLEARDRIGGRVYTDRSSLSVPVDLGASIITGVEADVATERGPDPSSLICTQLGLELTVLNSDCPLYDIVTGHKVPADLDEALEAEYNSLLDDMVVYVAENGESVMKMSLEDGLEYALKRRRMAHRATDAKQSDQVSMVFDSDMVNTLVSAPADSVTSICAVSNRSDGANFLSPLERRVMDWHFANLEYGCAALLKEVSLPYWNQDDVYGGFGGAHCMIKGGYSTVIESLGDGLDIHLNHVVTEIVYNMGDSDETGQQKKRIKVCTSNGNMFEGDAVLITIPLGCLKANTIRFSPVLPDWKQSSIQRLGFGVLNKVILEFPEVFWDDAVDYFGATAKERDQRGQCFMFWNVKKTVGAPVLIALVVGKAAIDGQSMSTSDHVNHALMVLRKLFGETSVPDPVASIVTNWGTDPFSMGAYSYVAIGALGEDYDILGRPIANCLFFAGEATCKEHPDTVGGAMMSGLREAVRIIDILTAGKDYVAEVESMEAVQRQSESERNEVRDMIKRLEASRFSSVLPKNFSEGLHMKFAKEASLKDMFSIAKTTSGRLYLAKELLRLPVETLKSFAGTREGLGILNIWILDSLGKNAAQLLRHCVRILVLVSTNLLAVRLSGIGRTVKEKVCVHTSRDIRAIASQLVGMWIDVFRKEKAANRGHKFQRQTAGLAPSKMKPKNLIPGKPPQRVIHETSDSRGKLQVSSSAGSDSSSKTNHKKADRRMSKIEPLTGKGPEVNSSSQNMGHSLDSMVDNSIAMSEEEAAAFAAAEAAHAAALAAAKAYASSEAEASIHELPKIPSFHKFARREQYAQMDGDDLRRKLSGGIYGKQDCISEIDSRNCRVRNWSVDFTAPYGNFDSSKLSAENYAPQSYSNEIACPLSLREHSGESGAVESRLTKAWVDTDMAGCGGVKDSLAIERWQSQAMDADADFFNSIHLQDEEDSTRIVKLPPAMNQRHTEESSASQAAENKSSVEGHPRGAGHIKQGVIDFVASLLMPLYKVGKIDREGYKLIMRKASTKVMDQCTEAEKRMAVYDFLDFRRKNKIRAFVDKLIERYMAKKLEMKS